MAITTKTWVTSYVAIGRGRPSGAAVLVVRSLPAWVRAVGKVRWRLASPDFRFAGTKREPSMAGRHAPAFVPNQHCATANPAPRDCCQ